MNDNEKKVYDYIRHYIEHHQEGPLQREMARTLNMPLTTVYHQLRKLRKKKLVDWDRYEQHSLRLVKK